MLKEKANLLEKTEKLIVARINLRYKSTPAQAKILEDWSVQLKKSPVTTLENKIKTWHEFEKKLKSLAADKKAIHQQQEKMLKKLDEKLKEAEQKRQSTASQLANIEEFTNNTLIELPKQLQELVTTISTLQTFDLGGLSDITSLDLLTNNLTDNEITKGLQLTLNNISTLSGFNGYNLEALFWLQHL